MKLWKISQTENDDWDTYDSAVVAAETESEAARVCPDEACNWSPDGVMLYRGNPVCIRGTTWATKIESVKVEYLGEAAEGTAPGVILASFNAG